MRSRRGALLALVLPLLLLVAPGAAQEAAADPDAVPSRVTGADRFDTAARVAELTFPSAQAAVVAAAGAFPDAVAGAGLSGALAAPVLLTARDEVPQRTREALASLGVRTVHLVGGEDVVSAAVAEELAADHEVHRVTGTDRWSTAAEVARAVAATVGVGTVDGDRTALLATGLSFPDALAAGPLAHALHLPVLLTHPEELPPATAAVLEELAVARVVLLGGPAAVSADVEQDLRDRGLVVERLAGADRAGTAVAVAEAARTRFGFDAATVLLARGDGYADSLAAGPRGGELRAPVLLAERPDRLGAATRGWLAARCPGVQAVQAVGGEAALRVVTLQAAEDAAEACSTTQRRLTYTTGTAGDVTADLAVFRDVASQALEDDRGWDLGGALEFTEVDAGGDLRVWLADPARVEAASPGCSAQWSCRVGDDVLINERRWTESTSTWSGRSLDDYRSYVLNHEVGHWLGLGHRSCTGSGQPAPVMQQQSIRLDGCTTNVWPLPSELDEVRRRWAG